jgi:tRNA pseudouridine13 synthase
VFLVTPEALAEPGFAERVARFEISPSGPMWGPEMVRAAGDVDRVEVDALAALGVRVDDLAAAQTTGVSLPGERRPLRVPLTFPEVEGGMDEHGPFVRVAFDLPRGAFATSVLREIMKPEVAGGEGVLEDEGG